LYRISLILTLYTPPVLALGISTIIVDFWLSCSSLKITVQTENTAQTNDEKVSFTVGV
jgi:hypothetical protein